MAEEKEKNIDDFLDEFDADGVGDYEWEEEHGSNEEQSTTISTKDDESTAPQTSQEPSLTVTSSSVKKDDPRGRVYPLAKICPRGKLDLMRQPPASVTAIVCLKNDPTKFFILGCGHAFYDYDANRDKSAVGDPTPNTVEWEWTGYPDDGVERTHSISYGRYYRMGDKLGSQLDASLCQIHANVKWSNEYRSYNIQTQKQTPTKRLIGLDGRWPPAANAETVYQAHEVMLSYSDFIIRDRFVTTWKTWDSRANPNNVAVLQNVMLRVRPGETVNGTNRLCLPCSSRRNRTLILPTSSDQRRIRERSYPSHHGERKSRCGGGWYFPRHLWYF
jgi:hypothetical protein